MSVYIDLYKQYSFDGHAIRIYREECHGSFMYCVTINSTDHEDLRWYWTTKLRDAAGIALLAVCGHYD